ncbi:uncharacterized protein LOC111302964 isoform X4 [Durio zibethinus]|uniref:Uncharacterized protein LOC111302964 isoform X4 n=1 Tax=Durio zibethinus TaxID=66656 RepID=A0A6P5ZP16_DURZI|nr:uncharacterized protein LOC111302964 isoform X4 [Durio zibethinus]
MASSHPASHRTHVPLSSESGGNPFDNDAPPVPIHIVTDASQLPREFLNPSPKRQLVVGFDCEGIDLCRHGTLCIMQALYFQFGIKLHNVMDTQIAYSLIEEQEGRTRLPDDYISFVGLLADPRYCGISYPEKEEVRLLLRQDPNFWTYRPLSELMVRAAADDVRFLLYIYHMMMGKLNQRSLWYLAVHGALYCQCFCVSDNNYADWPSVPPIPDNLITEGNAPEEEVLSILDVPQGKMGRVIGRKGASILSIKESCNAEIFLGGAKGPPDKVFIMGPVKQVRKAEAMLRGRMMD